MKNKLYIHNKEVNGSSNKRVTRLIVIICLCTVVLAGVVVGIVLAISKTTGGAGEANATPVAKITPQPRMSAEEPTQTEGPAYGNNPACSVVATVAYCFTNEAGKLRIYGAAEYRNSGDCPTSVSEATFDFIINGAAYPYVFSPGAYDSCAIMPGESSYIAAWVDASEIDAALTSVESVVMESCSLTVKRASKNRNYLPVTDEFLVQNYPTYATLSGDIASSSDETCTLNIVYSAFYGSKGELLGVWCFSENLALTAGDKIHFTSHMEALPIAGIVDDCVEIRSMAFGID